MLLFSKFNKPYSNRFKFKNELCVLFFIVLCVFTANAQDCSVNAGIDETICGDVTTYNLSGSFAGNFPGSPQAVWTQTGGPSVTIVDSENAETEITGLVGGNEYTFQYTGECSDGVTVSQDVTITVENITIADAGSDIETCPDSSGSVLISGNTPSYTGEVGTWSIVGSNSAGVTINTPSSSNSTIDLSEGNAGTTTLRWTITGPEYAPGLYCETYDEITITNYGGVDPVDAGEDQNLNSCYTVSQSTNLDGSFAGNGLGGQQGTWSFVSGPRQPNIVSPNDNDTEVNGLYEGTYVFRWTVSGPCVTGSDTVEITVQEATQDVTKASVTNGDQVFCDQGVTQTTLVGNQPEFAGETVEWTQTSGPSAAISDPYSPTTIVSGLSYDNTYKFRYSIINEDTGCSTSRTVTVSYNDNNLSIEANGGADIIGACGEESIDIPFVVTGSGVNEYSIVSGPIGAFTYPTDYQTFSDESPLTLTFDRSGTYNVVLRRKITGDILSECDISSTSINITISKSPTPANGGTNQVLECGNTTTELTGNEIESGKSLWTQITGPNQASIDNPYARVTGVSGLVPGNYVFRYMVTAIGGACVSEENTQSDVLVVVSDDVLTDDSDAGPDQSGICADGSVFLAGNEPKDGQKGTWSQVDDGAPMTVAFEDENDPNTKATGFDEKNQTYTIQWLITSESGSCTTTSVDEVAIITSDSEAPTPAEAGEDRCYAEGTTEFSLEGNSPKLLETGTWTVTPAGPVISDVNDPTTSVTVPGDGSYTFTWSIDSPNSCEITSDDVLIVVDTESEADAGPDQTGCSDTFTMAAQATSATGMWTQVIGPGGFTIVDETSPTTDINFTYSGSYVFEWTVSAGECSTASDQVTINVGLPPTTAVAGPDQTVCNGGNSITLAANDFDADTETGTWTSTSSSGVTPTITDPNDPNTTVTGLLTGIYTFTWSIKGDPNCDASTDDVEVRIGTPANAGSDQSLCNATSVLLEAEEGSTGTWSQISSTGADAVISQIPNNSNIANVEIVPGVDYVFEFTTDTPGCITTDQVTITNSGLPEYQPIAGDDAVVCQADLVPTNTYSLSGNTPPSGVTPEWRIADQPDGGSATITDPSSATTTITGLDVPGFYILEWNFSVGNCTTESDVLRLTVLQPPSQAEAGPNQDNACVLSAQMAATAPTAGVGEWTFDVDPSNGDAIIDSPNSPTTTISNITALGTYTLKWTVSTGPFGTDTSCAPTEDTVAITFTDEPPYVADAGVDQEICLIAPATTTPVTLDAEDFPDGDLTVGTWSLVSGPNTPNIADVNNPNTNVLGLVSGDYEFMWTTEKGGCTDSDTVLVTVYGSPTEAEAGPNQTIAEFTPLVLAGNTPTVGEGTWTQISGPTDAIFTNANNPSTSVNDISKGTYVFVWTITNGSCEDSTDFVKIEVIGSADLEISKTASSKSVTPEIVSPGDVITFTIEVFNNDVTGTSDATNVAVSDLLPDGYTIVNNSISDGGIYYSGNSVVRWEGLSIGLGETMDLTFEATVNKTGDYENKVLISASDQKDPDSDPDTGFSVDDLNDGVADDDEATALVVVEPADLELTKSANKTEANVGEEVTFRLNLVNNGPGSASNISVLDSIPSGYTFVSGSASNNGVYNAGDNTIVWDDISLNSGFTSSLLYKAIPNSTGTDYTNIAQITASSNEDPDSDPETGFDEDDLNDGIADDDEVSLTVPISYTDLSLSKTVDNTTPNVGDIVVFTLTVTNESTTTDATNITVEDYVPSGYKIITINNSGLKIGNTIRWTGFSIPAGASLTSSFTAEVQAPEGTTDEYLNIAQITEMDQADSDSTPDNDDGDQSEDDEDNAVVTPEVADLSLTKVVNDLTPVLSDVVTFTVEVTNDGPNDATGVNVVDILPSGYTLQTVNNGGFASGNTATWNNLSIANGNTVSLTYTATVIEGDGSILAYTNTAQVTASDQYDPDSTPNNNIINEDDQAIANTVPQNLVDIEVTKVSDVQTVVNGSTVVFTITVANNGPGNATGVKVEDRMGTNLTYVSHTESVGTYTVGPPGDWDVGNLAAGASETLTITTTVNNNVAGDYTNIAELLEVNETDVDSSPDNNIPSEDDQDEVDLSATLVSDLNLTKTVDLSEQVVGEDVTFSITVTNEGPNSTSGVVINDLLPTGYAFVSFTATEGTYDQNTGDWALASPLGVGEVDNLQIRATVLSTGDYLNRAEIIASANPDSDSDVSVSFDVDDLVDGIADDDEAEVEVTPIPSIDLSLTKTVNNSTPNIGDEVIFTVTVTNDGLSEATDVTVKDLLADGLEYVSDNSGGNYDEATGIWTVGSLAAAGATSAIEITAKVLLYDDTQPIPLEDYFNSAEVFSANEDDVDSTPNNGDDSEDDYDELQVTPNPTQVDLSVEKTVDNLTPSVGDNITFTIDVTNDGPQDATGVIVTDKLNQPGFAYVSHTVTVGNYVPNSGAWSVGDLPLGTTETLTITATVEQTGSYVNTAQVTGQDQLDFDSTPSNNDPAEDDYDTVIVTPVFEADLTLNKSVNNPTQDVGKLVNFELVLTNNGPSSATGVTVTDLLPDGYTFVGAIVSEGSYDETTGLWSLSTEIPVGAQETLELVARVNSSGTYLNEAEVTASDQVDPTSTPNDGAGDDYDTAIVTPNLLIDLNLDKQVSKLLPNVGERIYYTLILTNDGPNEATNIEVTDMLPSGVTFVSYSGTGSYDEGTGIWNVSALGVDETVFLKLNVTVNTSGTYINTTEVTAADQNDIDSTPNNGIDSEDDYAEKQIIPRTPSDIEVEKIVDNETPSIGEVITFTVSVYNNPNNGTYISDATGIIVEDVLPSGLGFVEATTSDGTYDETTGVWNIGDLANGATATMTMEARVRAAGNYTNTAELIASDTNDPDSTPNDGIGPDDISTVDVTPVVAADLSLTKTVGNATPKVGELIQFGITVSNDGPGVARGIEVTDILPAGFTYETSSSSYGSYDSSTGIWTLNGLLLSGDSETLTIIARVNPSSAVTDEYLNTAEITASANKDPDSTPNNGVVTEDDYAEVLVTPIPQIDLALTKTVSKLVPSTGEEIVFTITLENAGPSNASGIEVLDLLPDGYLYVSDNSNGLYDNTTGIWSVGDLASGSETILTITVEVLEGEYLNIAEVSAANEEDINSTPGNNDPDENDQDQAQILARVTTDISVLKEVSSTEPSVGDEITFTINVLNDGPSTATGVVVKDLLPSGYTYVSSTQSTGTYDQATGGWDIGVMPNKDIQTLTIVAQVLGSGRYTNTAELIALDTYDPDSTPNNGVESEDDQSSVSPFAIGLADLSLTKEVDNAMPNVGEQIQFVIQVTNNGESDASGVEVTDILPAGFTYVSSFATAGTYNETTGIWKLNTKLIDGNTEVLSINVTVNEPTGNIEDFTNWALITASDTEDPDSDPNTDETEDDLNDGIEDDDEASVIVSALSVDLGLEKTVNDTQPTIGNDVVFTMTVTNLSATEATNIGIEDVLPSGYNFVNAIASAGTYDERTGIWTITSLAGNANATLEITATVLDVNDYVNVVSLAYLDQLDINPDNDTAEATVTPNCLTIYNEFSPNGDGTNDYFYIDCISQYPNNRLEVYNRWGSLVHAEDGYNNDWDGTTDGKSTDKVLPIGTYYYVLDLKDGSEPKSGWLYLNR